MYIMTQDETGIYDTEQFWGIVSEHCQVKGLLEGAEIVLGTYKTQDRANEMLMDIFIQMDIARYQMPII